MSQHCKGQPYSYTLLAQPWPPQRSTLMQPQDKNMPCAHCDTPHMAALMFETGLNIAAQQSEVQNKAAGQFAQRLLNRSVHSKKCGEA